MIGNVQKAIAQGLSVIKANWSTDDKLWRKNIGRIKSSPNSSFNDSHINLFKVEVEEHE